MTAARARRALPEKLIVGRYLRKSTKSGIGGSITQQREVHVDDQLDQPSWIDGPEFVDNNRSASLYATRAREDYARLVEAIVTGAINVLWVWEISRSNRDIEEFGPLRALCRKHGVLIYVSREGRMFDMRVPADGTYLAREVVKGEEESNLIAERVLRMTKRMARRGLPTGTLPYGYARHYDPKTGRCARQLAHPEYAPIVVEIAHRYSIGDSTKAIAADLTKRGVFTPDDVHHNAVRPGPDDEVHDEECTHGPGPRRSRWTIKAVRAIATSPTYIGQRRYRGKHEDLDPLLPGSWPALIDIDTYAACLARRQAASDLAAPHRRPGRDPIHLLTGIARCGVCGAGMRVKTYAQRGAATRYHCKGPGHVQVLEDVLDEYIVDVFMEYLLRDDVAEAVALDTSAEAVSLRAQLAALHTEYDEWEAFSADNGAAVTGKNLKRVREAIKATQDRLTQVAVPPMLRVLVSDPDGPEAAWANMTTGQRRAAIDEQWIIEVHPAGKGTRTFDPTRRVTVTPRTRRTA